MMMKAIRAALRPLLRASYVRFKEQLKNPERAQENLLKDLIRNLSATEYGRSLGVGRDDDYRSFSRKTPIANYDQISPWIERQKSDEGNILVSEPVLFYEKSSGSSGPAKYIPYTRGLRDSFNRMFLIWLYDLLERGPRFETGKTFLSVSPAFRENQTTSRGVKVGLDDDVDYLNPKMRWLLKRFLVLPASIKQLGDPEDFKRVLSALLLSEAELEIISVWNPSLLETILDYVQANGDALIDDLKKGVIACGDIEFKFKKASGERLAPLAARPVDWARVWPRLKLISCWTSGNASRAAQRIAGQFPCARVQGKGLLATEAPMTLPLIESRGYAPLPAEIFYEFLDDRGVAFRLHELEAGREYEIILTQKGGLYRYRIGDRVRVSHYYEATPCFEFAGRADEVCDLVGEKLNESFAQECISRLPLAASRFQTLLPVMTESGRSYYVLVTDELASGAGSIESELDNALCEAYHYRAARLLGQLDRAKALARPQARDLYYSYFMSQGMKWGDIKHQYLIKNVEDAANLMSALNASPVEGCAL
jgi:GH3 auxin-responsive promoter